MAGRPRSEVIQEDVVGVYHCWNRCVRRAYLCGRDPVSGRNCDHRKAWIIDRLEDLSKIFAIDACVWAVLSNHYHLIVRNRPDLVTEWTDEDVATRWWYLFPEREDDGEPAQPSVCEIRSIVSDKHRIEELRKRLSSISWLMKCLNEEIAVKANAEDGLTGHFWQDRFGCRSLLDEGAILACSIYVDLNEIRADLAASPEDSTNTSAYRRILARLKLREMDVSFPAQLEPGLPTQSLHPPDSWLCPIHDGDRAPLLEPGRRNRGTDPSLQIAKSPNLARKRWRHGFLPITLDEYLDLLDWTGRQTVLGKPGKIDSDLSPILTRLNLRPAAWLKMVEMFEGGFHSAVGNPNAVVEEAARRGRSSLHGIESCRSVYC